MAKPINGDLLPKTSKYPWHEWADGRQWSLLKGDDFMCNVAAFKSSTHAHASKIGKKVVFRVFGETEVRIQFRDK